MGKNKYSIYEITVFHMKISLMIYKFCIDTSNQIISQILETKVPRGLKCINVLVYIYKLKSSLYFSELIFVQSTIIASKIE